MGLDIVVFGLALSSSWGNGHATTWRALLRALAARGHRITFFERDQPWHRESRDLAQPPFCRLVIYKETQEIFEQYTHIVRHADAVIVGSFVTGGVAIGDWVLHGARGITAFYDIDAPVTQQLLTKNACDYLTREQARAYDIYLSAAGGPMLEWLRCKHGVHRPRPLYCSADPHTHRPMMGMRRYSLGFLGTYSADREAGFRELFLKPAALLPGHDFAVAGSQYPQEELPANVRQIGHLAPGDHAEFYAAQSYTLNLTRADMMKWGYSPSVRLFEAAACGTPVITDDWPGLAEFFTPGEEILVARNAQDVAAFITTLDKAERQRLASRARARVLAQHTAHHRARALEAYLKEATRARKRNGKRAA